MDETFRTFHNILGLVGISFFAKTDKPSNRWLFLQIFNFALGFLTFAFTSGFVIAHFDNPLLFIQGACIWTTGVIMFISLGVCLLFRDKFRMFLNEMAFNDGVEDMPLIKYALESDNVGKLDELRELVINSQKNLFRFTRILLKSYVASVWLSATLYLCGPIYQMIIFNDPSMRLLAFDMWFPWSLDNFNVYVASFIFHAYAGYLCCIAYPGLQSTIILLVGQTIRQLRIITFVLQNLNELSEQLVGSKRENWQYCCTEIFSQCIKHYVKIKRYLYFFPFKESHTGRKLPGKLFLNFAVCVMNDETKKIQEISIQILNIRFTNRLNVICQPFYLALILVAIMLVCMCSVKIAVSSKLSPDTLKYFLHEFVFILVILMFCMLGQQVQNECENLQLAVTEKWYLYDKNHKTNVLIFNMAVSQGMPIYIFGSVTLSLPTFTWFIKTMMSFFTLVMSVLEG